nr:MAG TPA: hypothetical protein [Caudoviricetes sp.]DAK62083.1 MAG TPA: hypothetical protein [Caudoviricetes sp.]
MKSDYRKRYLNDITGNRKYGGTSRNIIRKGIMLGLVVKPKTP